MKLMGFRRCSTQAWEFWLKAIVAPCHVGSSEIRDRTLDPALVSRFLSTVPPGKCMCYDVLNYSLSLSL